MVAISVQCTHDDNVWLNTDIMYICYRAIRMWFGKRWVLSGQDMGFVESCYMSRMVVWVLQNRDLVPRMHSTGVLGS